MKQWKLINKIINDTQEAYNIIKIIIKYYFFK